MTIDQKCARYGQGQPQAEERTRKDIEETGFLRGERTRRKVPAGLLQKGTAQRKGQPLLPWLIRRR